MTTVDPAIDHLRSLLDPPPPERKSWYNDPVLFAKTCVEFPSGSGLTDYQADVLQHLVSNHRVAQRGPHGLGKAQPYNVVIDTPVGPRKFGDLQVGDQVFGANGKPTTVTGVFERGEMDTYRVTFNDKSSTVCSLDHLWTVRKFKWANQAEVEWETKSLGELLDMGLTRSNGNGIRTRRWAIPTVEPLQYPWSWVPVDPYTLGAWLGDGTSAAGRITGNDQEVADRIRKAGYQVRELRREKCASTFSVYGLAPVLRRIGLLGSTVRTKAVPPEYLYNLPEVRREVLRGLLDTDGTVTPEGTISFSSVSTQLAADVAWLARSLGGMARLHERHNKFGPHWLVLLTLPVDRWFYIERKQARVRPTSQKRYLWRWIDKVEPEGREPVRCIQVDAPDHLYVANDGIVTHNTTVAALAVHWFALSRECAGIDWKIITTAGVWYQLKDFLWPEIRLWADRLRWDVIGREPYSHRTELLALNLKLKNGAVSTVASNNPAFIEGAHAREIMYVFDEAKVIEAATFDAAEGAFSTGEAYALASSTPGDPAGRFYDIHQRKPGYEDWWTRHVSKDEVIAAGRMNPEWVTRRASQWGADSAIFANKVLGEFHSSDTDSVIPLSWVEAAVDRWRDWWSSGAPSGPLTDLGVDVAREGSDKTVLAFRHGDLISELQYTTREDTMQTTGRAMAALGSSGARPVVDVIGVGGGVVDRLREQGIVVDAFTAGASTDIKDRSNEIGFVNCRSAAWWTLREALDPAFGSQLALPDDDLLIGDLVAPKYTYTSKGLIQVESKDLIRKRIGRSTDAADAVVQSLWPVKHKRGHRMVYYPS